VNAQTCEQFRAALRARGTRDFNEIVRTVRPPATLGRLCYWQEQILLKIAAALGVPELTYAEAVEIFAGAELMYEPPSELPTVRHLLLLLPEFEATLARCGAGQFAAEFFTLCRAIDLRADVAEYLVGWLNRPVLQALVQESLARLHPKYVESAEHYATQSQDPGWIADRRATERKWAELFFRATR
jgi:hypothetical protein